MIIEEIFEKGVYLVFVLVLDIFWDLCWGCVEECYGEDLYFVVELIVVIIEGF